MITVPVIIAGGAGTRLWPLSNEEKPKQFHNFLGGGSLLENTIKRLLPLSPETCVIVTARKYEELSLAVAQRVGVKAVVLAEPQPRNTAAAVLYAACYINKRHGSDAVMLVLPADHHVKDDAAFADVIRVAVQQAAEDKLVTVGITPEYAETGYGYIKAGERLGEKAFAVERFVEKPDAETAQKYIAAGGYYWNAGIFVWKVSAIMQAFAKHMPAMSAAFEELGKLPAEDISSSEGGIWQMKTTLFRAIESISIDYGIMERAEDCAVAPANFGWADLGSWKSVSDALAADTNGNGSPNPANAIFVDAKNCAVFAEDACVAVVGLENVAVVKAGDKILVINKDAAQKVRDVVDIIRGQKNK